MEEEIKTPEIAVKTVEKTYPLVEEMTFRGIIKCEADGYALLRAVQIMVNELGTETIITIMAAVEKNPKLLQQAKSYLPYILKM